MNNNVMNNKMEKKLITLFSKYLEGFKQFDLVSVVQCYHLPCTLATPDNLVLINNTTECEQEFNNIFTQLKQNCTSDIVAKKLSFQPVTDNLALVCIDWDFLDEKRQVFADFSAIYHVVEVEDELKIIQVVSHDLTNSLSLKTTFNLV